MQTHKIICVSNRLPVSAKEEGERIEFVPSSGGLVTAVGPILRKSRGMWIGWPGSAKSDPVAVAKALAEFSAQSDFDVAPVFLDQESVTGFYQGFSSQIVWPLFHDLQTLCNFEPEFWLTYQKVQTLFANETVKQTGATDLVWVHDYHLMGLGEKLREQGVKNKICFFLHTPFPGPDIFLKLPWRSEVIASMLSYDVIGFQTRRDYKNFTACLAALTNVIALDKSGHTIIQSQDREIFVGNFPISIDFNEFEELARLPEVEERLHTIRANMNVDSLILSIDRLDYTKGIPHRIRAFRRLLEKHPELKTKIALLQVVVPSRMEVPEYQTLQSEIEKLVTQLNGEFGEPGWVPVHHLFRSLTREEVVAMYRSCNVALVTPLQDGMNLVAKEYCAARLHNGGSLVLSEFAGASQEFKGLAYLVNPYDIDGVANALAEAIAAPKEVSTARMQGLRDIVRKSDVFSWASSFLDAANWQWTLAEETPRPANVWDKLRRMSNVFDM